jgi:hypothetical protein
MADELDRSETISYDRLYRLWEQNPWSATSIDFTVDAEHWQTKLDERQRESALWNYAMFLVGEEAVARTLTPVLDAAPSSCRHRSSTSPGTTSSSIASCARSRDRARTPTRR